MFALHGRGEKLCDGVTRREVLRVGGLSAMGLSLPTLLRAKETATASKALDPTFGRAKNVIFLWLQGGPPQHETFDPKPDAPAEIRGVFKPIQTNVPDIHFCELLPRTARRADKLAVVRSMATDDNIHSSSGYWVLTGYKYVGPNARTIQPTDWPYFGSLVKMHRPSKQLPPLTSVWVPDLMRLNENVTPAGQTGGFLGRAWDPERIVGDPSDPNYEVKGLEQTEISPLRLKHRISLLEQIEQHYGTLERGGASQLYDTYQQQAFDLITAGRAREAFAIGREPQRTRAAYGHTKWGQTVLLARRLIEAGVRLVHVNWCREPGDSAVDNPMWDTHAQNADRMEDVLCPQFDVGFTALLDDLEGRGLLDETLVVAVGEFGRTPKINPLGGRDHWGSVFSFVLAGAGISGGQVYGSSDKNGAYPKTDRVEPQDLTATIFHLLGIDPAGVFLDRGDRPHRLTLGTPIYRLLGTEPATRERTTPGGDLARLGPLDDSPLLNTDFETNVPLRPVDFGSRPKGWRATPLADGTNPGAFGVRLVDGNDSGSEEESRHVVIGYGIEEAAKSVEISQGIQALLAQEIRNPRVGHFALSVSVSAEGSSRGYFENVFLTNFTCRLVIFRYADAAKDPTRREELASATFRPTFSDADERRYETFQLRALLDSSKPGSNFAIGKGLGAAVVVEKTSAGVLWLEPGKAHRALLRIDDVKLDYRGRGFDENVKV